MTVWIENPFDNLPQEGFRPQRYWLMSEAFAAAGWDVVLWTSDFNHTTKRRREICRAVPGGRIQLRLVPTVPYYGNVSLARVRSHRAYAREWGRMALDPSLAHPDVIIVSSPPLSTGDVAIGLARRFGAKLVVDVMDAWPETFYRLLPGPLRWTGPLAFLPLHRAARRLYRAADMVTGVCDRYEALVRSAGAKTYFRAYHGLALPSAALVRKGDAADGKRSLRLVYAGNLGRTYGIRALVDAVEANDGWTLDVAGRGEQEGLLAGRGRVRYHGYLGADELQALLRECDIGVVPMAAESQVGVPYKFGDYSASSLAIVSSLGGESASLLERYGAGEQYAACDAESLAAAVRRIEARLSEARAASRRMAEAEFDADKIYAAYVDAVKGILS